LKTFDARDQLEHIARASGDHAGRSLWPGSSDRGLRARHVASFV